MRRFFTTFFLLAGVAFSLVISDSFFKIQKKNYTAESSKSELQNSFKNKELYKSIDLTEADVYDSKRNTVRVSHTN